MPSGPTSSCAGQRDLRVLDHHRAGLAQTVEALLDDPQRLTHLLHPDPYRA